MDEERIEEFRRQAEQFRQQRSHPAVPWPAPLRDWAIRYAAEQQRRGVGRSPVARRLGLSVTTLGSWQKRARSPGLRPVVVRTDRKDAEPPGTPVSLALRSPRGYQVVGLDVADALALLRELG